MTTTIDAIAAVQYGVIAKQQARAAGLSPAAIQRRLTTGRWIAVHPGVYRLAGAPRSWRQRVLAACLACGDRAAASHRCAAALRLLPGFPPGSVEIAIPRSVDRHPHGVVVHRPQALDSVDVEVVGAIPVTTVARTLIDLAAIVSRDVLEEALDDALRRGLVTLPRLRWRLQEIGGKGRAGVTMLAELIDARSDGDAVPRSVFETRLLRLLRGAGLPLPVRQHPVRDRGRVIGVVDFAYPDHRVGIEADSRAWHFGKRRWERDLARHSALTAQGWRVLHITWLRLVKEPQAVAAEIAAALRRAPAR